MGDFKVSKPIESMDGAFDVSGKNVVVTGGNRGIGKGITDAFAQSGANVAIICRNAEHGTSVVEELKEQYPDVSFMFAPADLSDYDACGDAVKSILNAWGHIDVLINNAGVSTTTGFLQDERLSEWHRVIDTDLHGVANMCHHVVPAMIDHGDGGCIINISSTGGYRPPWDADMPGYNAAKAGVDIFTRYLQNKVGGENIRVLSVRPGPIHSGLDDDLPEIAKDTFYNKMAAHRFGEPIEVGAFCVFLASPAASFIRGTNFLQDGGLTLVM